MRRIAIIGAGQAGTLAAVGLMKRGYEVTLYSDRTADDILHNTAPTGIAFMFAESVACERDNGCHAFDEEALDAEAIHLCFLPKSDVQLVHISGNLDQHTGRAVDLRLKSKLRMDQLEAGSAELVIQSITPEDLDDIAAAHDLTLVATGKGGLSNMFERDPERSVYDRPQRNLGMVIVRGIPTEGSPFPHRLPGKIPVCFNFYGDMGECFWTPFYHKTEGRCWSMLIEARPGSPIDRFDSVQSAEDMLDLCRHVIRTHAPWDWESMKDMELVADDPHCWRRGRITPTVRKSLGRTPSGHRIMSLGDTSYTFDPIAGQGAACGARQAAFYVDAIAERGEQAFDDEWITATGETFYEHFAGPTYRFNNVLLEPLDAVGKLVVISAFGDERIAREFFQRFNRPPTYFPWLQERDAARAFIKETTGLAWQRAFAKGMFKIARGQLRQKLQGRHFTYSEARPPIASL